MRAHTHINYAFSMQFTHIRVFIPKSAAFGICLLCAIFGVVWRKNTEVKQAMSPVRSGLALSRSELLTTATPGSAASSQHIAQTAKMGTPMKKQEKIVRDPKTGKGNVNVLKFWTLALNNVQPQL